MRWLRIAGRADDPFPGRQPGGAVSALASADDAPADRTAGVDDAEVAAAAFPAPQATLDLV
jgi:hypothetical protein